MLTNAPVTVYHFDAEKNAYIALSFLKAHVFSEKKAAFSAGRKEDATRMTVRIPVNTDAFFIDNAAPESTIVPGDYLTVGAFFPPEAALKISGTSPYFSGKILAPDKAKSAIVTGVTVNFDSTNPHLKLTCIAE